MDVFNKIKGLLRETRCLKKCSPAKNGCKSKISRQTRGFYKNFPIATEKEVEEGTPETGNSILLHTF